MDSDVISKIYKAIEIDLLQVFSFVSCTYECVSCKFPSCVWGWFGFWNGFLNTKWDKDQAKSDEIPFETAYRFKIQVTCNVLYVKNQGKCPTAVADAAASAPWNVTCVMKEMLLMLNFN